MKNFISLKNVLVVLAVLFGASIASISLANTFTVNSTNDIGKDAATSACLCKATGISLCTLRAAVETANLCVSTTSKNDQDNIVLTGGSTYALKLGKALSITKGGMKIYASSGNATIDIDGQDRIFYVNSGTKLYLQNLTLSKGSSKDTISGGAIFNQGMLSITKSTIKNSNSLKSAGAIYNAVGATLTIAQSTIEGNTATESGGGIYNNGTMTINSSTVGPTNTATNANGGGIVNGGTAVISNSTISGNTSKLDGGGIYDSGTITLKHATVTNNAAGKGGGIVAATNASFSVYNSIVIKNSGPAGYQNCSGNFSGKINVISGAGCGFPNDSNENIELSTGEGASTLLKALADNGGPTKTHALNTAVKAMDAANAGWAISVDQRGYNRDKYADIGAFEFIGTCNDGFMHFMGGGEQCEDGNVKAGDGCSVTCQFEPKIIINIDMNPITGPINFEKVVVGSEKSKEIGFFNAKANSLLKIDSITMKVGGTNYPLPYSGDNFSAEVKNCATYPIIPGAGCIINVIFNPAIAGVFEAQLSIKSNDPTNPETLISLNGEGYDDVVLVNPSNIIFSDAKLYEAASEDLVISNSGMTLVNGKFSNLGDFTIEVVSCIGAWDNFSIKASDSCTFKVKLTPQGVKTYTSTLKITTDHKTSSEFNIPLEAKVSPPIISTEPADTLDFGNMVMGEAKELPLTIKNSGASKLKLQYNLPAANDAIYSSYAWSSEPCDAIPAQGSCEVKIKVKPKYKKIGAFEETFTILSNDPENPTKVIKLVGVAVVPKVQLSATEINFGDVIMGESKEGSVTILNVGNSDLLISEISDLSDLLDVSSISQACMDMPIVIKPNESCEMKFKFSPPTANYNLGYSVWFDTNGSPDLGCSGILSSDGSSFVGCKFKLTMTGKGVHKPDQKIAISPPEIDFGKITAGLETSQKEVSLYNSGAGKSLTVTDVSLSGEGFELLQSETTPCGNLPITISSGKNCSYDIKFEPASPVEYSGTLTITSDSGNIPGSKSVISIKGTGKKIMPEISLKKVTYDFGELAVGSTASDTITIANSTAGDLVISKIDDIIGQGKISNDFSLVGKEACIKTLAGQFATCELGVEFHPKSVGSFAVFTIIYSNDEDNSMYMVVFKGKASGPGISVDPTEISFSKILVGDTLTWPVKITNTAGKADLKVTNMAVSGTDYSLKVSGELKYCESSTPVVKAGDHCIVGVVFKPSSASVFDGTLKMTMEDLPDVEVTINGIGYVEDAAVPSKVVCGNKITEEGEACDDGNVAAGDGCSSVCKIEDAATVTSTTAVCGNGMAETDEDCDDGNATDTDACSNTCKTVTTSTTTGGEGGGATASGAGGGGSGDTGGGTGATSPEGGGGGCSLIR